MATNVVRMTPASQDSLVKYAQIVLDLHQRQSTYREKMDYIDIAYARYKAEQAENPGDDRSGAGAYNCGVNIAEIQVPIVVSQVDAYVGYFADVFLSGYPTFPVVSTYKDRTAAEQLESIIDDHSIKGRYPRHLLMSFRDDAKYNFSAIEVDWAPIDIYNVTDAITQLNTPGKGQQNKLEPSSFYINKVNRLNPRNTLWDYRYHPVDVPYRGEYAGYIELVSRIEMKKILAYYGGTGDGYNTTQVMSSSLGKTGTVEGFQYYTEDPQISELIGNRDLHKQGLFDWISYFAGRKQSGKGAQVAQYSDIYEHLVLYVRMVPAEHGIDSVPNKGTPQVWKLCFVNHNKLVYAKRIYSLYDMLPVLFSQPFEDGFGMQTKSLAENAIPFQDAASDLFAIRMNSARRAVVDRAIYDPKMLNSADVNAPYASAKIPLRDGQTLAGKKLADAYHQIPFDSRGTETVISDMGQVVKMADMMNGINQGIQGQHVKGNKTRKEWEDTQEGAHNKMRLPALAIEFQKMLPLKEFIKLNIYQYGVDGLFQNQNSGETYEINAAKLQEIKKKVGGFKIADGFTPAEKMASTGVLEQGIGLLSQSPLLQQQLGPVLGPMFIHMMSLGGVKSFEQYLPDLPTAQPQAGPPAGTGSPVTPPTPGAPVA